MTTDIIKLLENKYGNLDTIDCPLGHPGIKCCAAETKRLGTTHDEYADDAGKWETEALCLKEEIAAKNDRIKELEWRVKSQVHEVKEMCRIIEATFDAVNKEIDTTGINEHQDLPELVKRQSEILSSLTNNLK